MESISLVRNTSLASDFFRTSKAKKLPSKHLSLHDCVFDVVGDKISGPLIYLIQFNRVDGTTENVYVGSYFGKNDVRKERWRKHLSTLTNRGVGIGFGTKLKLKLTDENEPLYENWMSWAGEKANTHQLSTKTGTMTSEARLNWALEHKEFSACACDELPLSRFELSYWSPSRDLNLHSLLMIEYFLISISSPSVNQSKSKDVKNIQSSNLQLTDLDEIDKGLKQLVHLRNTMSARAGAM